MKGIVYGIFLRLTGAILAFLVNFFVIKILGVEHSAEFFYLFTLSSVFSALLTYGYYNYIMSRGKGASLFLSRQYLFVHLVIFLPFSFVAYGLCLYLGFKQEFNFILIAANVPLAYLVVYASFLNKNGRYLQSVFIQNVSVQLVFVLGLLALDSFDVVSESLHVSYIFLLAASLVGFFSFLQLGVSRPRYGAIKLILRRSAPFFIIVASAQIYMWGVNIISIFTLEKVDYSALVIIQRFAFSIGIVISVVDSYSSNKFQALFSSRNYVALTSKMVEFTLLSIAICSAIFVTVIAVPELLLSVFSNELIVFKTELIIVCVAQLINCATGPTGTFLMMTGHQEAYKKLVWYVSVASIFLAAALGQAFGLLGVCLVILSASVFQNVFCVLFIKRKFKFYTFDFTKVTS